MVLCGAESVGHTLNAVYDGAGEVICGVHPRAREQGKFRMQLNQSYPLKLCAIKTLHHKMIIFTYIIHIQ